MDLMADLGVRFGFQAGGSADRIAELEAAGIDSLWTGGHIASRNPSSDAMIGLARLAALTERVQVGTAILLLPLYPPAIVARQVADLDRLTNGRVVLGVGVGGEYPQEFRACQVPVSERGRRTDEAIPLLRTLWTAEPITHSGRFYAMENVQLHPGPVQPGGPPIIVAGRQEVAMRRAAALGDGWMPYMYSPRRYAESVATVRQAAASAGRDLAGFQWFAHVFINAGPDGDDSRRDAAAAIGGNYNQDFTAMIDRVAAAGTPAQVASRLKEFVDAGARHFVLTPMSRAGYGELIISRLLKEVLPEVRTYAEALAS
jgi:probable F420-dependent oxidoreductase